MTSDSINNGGSHLLTKPESMILMLINSLEPDTQSIPVKRNTCLQLKIQGDNVCYLLKKGHVMINRREDHLTLNTESAPFIFGLAAPEHSEHLTLTPSADSVIQCLPINSALSVIQDNDLWEPLSYLLGYITSRIFCHCTRMAKKNAYEIIRVLLLEFTHETETLRQKESIVEYILSRCFLSRSGTLAILSALRKASYIEMRHGKLISIKSLPEKF